MRKGMILSAAAHGGLLLGLLLVLATPRPFETQPQDAITVDVVTPAEAPPEPKAPAAPASLQAPAAQETQAQPAAAAATVPPGMVPLLDPGALLAMYNMRVPGPGFDAPAEQVARLRVEDVRRLRAHLRRCWRLPEGLSPSSTAQVVIRVALAENGALLAEPSLVSASASREGPLVMQAAIAALEACQPYGFLPRDRYSEWKVFDIGFSPREMAGG